MARNRILPGMKVRVCAGSGCLSDQIVTVAFPSEIKLDGRGVPALNKGHYNPIDFRKEVGIRMSDGTLDTMFINRLVPIK
jgi:hypothetical protein